MIWNVQSRWDAGPMFVGIQPQRKEMASWPKDQPAAGIQAHTARTRVELAERVLPRTLLQCRPLPGND